MKLKLSMVRRRAAVGDISVSDILISADVTVTVGEIAARILATGVAPRDASLRIQYPGSVASLVLDPLAPLPSAHLRPGSLVEAVQLSAVGPAETRAFTVRALLRANTGDTWPLVEGRNLIGRDKRLRVWIPSRTVSRKHAEIVIDDRRATIVDLGAANPLMVNGQQIETAQLRAGDKIGLGDQELVFQTVLTPEAPSAPATYSEHIRSPRVENYVGQSRITLPAPPEAPAPQHLPTLAILAPLIMGIASFALTRSPYSLVLIAMSPLMMLGSWLDGIFGSKKDYKRQLSEYHSGLARIDDELTTSQQTECVIRNRQFPDADTLSGAIIDHADLLWTRRPEHSTFLELRVGTGTDLSRTQLELPQRGKIPDAIWQELLAIQHTHECVEDVPLLLSFIESGSIGIVGDVSARDDVMRHILVQLAGLHAPSELVVSAITGTDVANNWRWLKWLPHVDPPHSPLGGPHIATGKTDNARLIARLEELVALRQTRTSTHSLRSHLPNQHRVGEDHGVAVTELPTLPAVVVLIAGDTEVDPGRLVQLAEVGPDVGVYTLWLQRMREQLPAACRSFVEIPADLRATVSQVRTAVSTPVKVLDRLNMISAERVARELSGINDAGARIFDDSDLPSRVTLHELTPFDITGSAQGVVAAWRQSDSLIAQWHPGSERTPGTLPAIVGIGSDGPLTLDLRDQGPHALVGGTTGSGKSEFLQTWIMSMAATISPDRLTFLLVDYKGGAAFAECVDLPHTVGLVTDLSPHLVQRALTSLRAELTYREHLLNEHGAKDLAMMERRADVNAPPSLVIVIDEFAALAADIPEFVDGVVDVAARGRSLGVHLIMATQRPGGVITDNLRANTNLRVALRMADPNDSSDVIDTELAAHFDPAIPGRGAVRVGPGRITGFQTAYIGGRMDAGLAQPDLRIWDLPFGPGSRWPTAQQVKVKTGGRREIETILRNVTAAAGTLELASPRRPWLDQLPKIIELETIVQSTDAKTWTIGVQDEPAAQRQRPLEVAPETHGHMSIVGAAASGKSSTLRTIAAVATNSATPQAPVWIYAISSGTGLAPLSSLPNVGDILDVEDNERIPRLLKWLVSLAKQRNREYAKAQVSNYAEWLVANPIVSGDITSSARIVLLVDGYSALQERFELHRQFDFERTLDDLLAFGAKTGIHVIVATDRQRSIPQRYRGYFGAELVLRVTEDEATALDVPPGFFTDAAAGRGLFDTREVQIAIPKGATTAGGASEAFTAIASQWHSRFAHTVNGGSAVAAWRAPAIRLLPERIPLPQLPATDPDDNPTIAMADDDFGPVGYPRRGITAVLGRNKSGTSTLLRTLVVASKRATNPMTRITWLTADQETTVAPTDVLLVAGEAAVAAELSRLYAGGSDQSGSQPSEGSDSSSDSADSASWDFAIPSAVAAFADPNAGIFTEATLTVDTGAVDTDTAGTDSGSTDSGPSDLGQSPAAQVPDLVVIERMTDFIGTATEPLLVKYLGGAARLHSAVVVEADTGLIATSWDLHSALRAARATFILRPIENDGYTAVRVTLPDEDTGEFSPGRGYQITNGEVRKIQIALPE